MSTALRISTLVLLLLSTLPACTYAAHPDDVAVPGLCTATVVAMQATETAPSAAATELRTIGPATGKATQARPSPPPSRSTMTALSIDVPPLVLTEVQFDVRVQALRQDGTVDDACSATVRLQVAGAGREVKLQRGVGEVTGIRAEQAGRVTLRASVDDLHEETEIRAIPGLLSILPPLLAILLALLIRQVVVSLFAGVWLGAVFVFDYNPAAAFLRVLDHYIINGLAQPDHMSIIAFSMLFGGMVGVITRSGGTAGIAEILVRLARTPRRGQFATWLLGFVVFFDDYANALIVGNTMRPITDRLRVSREKLAYLVDATAAPVTSLLFVSTWIGYEVGLIDTALNAVSYDVESAYAVFLEMLPYSFYPILALVFGGSIALTGRDFGPMRRAEERARRTGALYREGAQLATDLTDSSSVQAAEGVPLRWWNAAVPIAVVLVAAVAGLIITGRSALLDAGEQHLTLGAIVGEADSYRALLWASLLSCVVAIGLAVGQRILSLREAMDAWFNGLKSMLLAMLILTLAWSIGSITEELHTADYLVELLRGNLSPHALPAATFIVAGIVSFSTGTSWGTMGILMPIVLPLSIVLSQSTGLDPAATHVILLSTTSSVLAGAVFGDHCSPISDTTILSSMASACDHIDHVRTQLPYTMIVALVALLLGCIPAAYGVSPFLVLPVTAVVLFGIIMAFGKRNNE